MKKLFILFITLVLILIGCITSGPTKKEHILTPLTNKVFMEKHSQNGRSYHIATFTDNIQYKTVQMQIYELNGVQSVYILPYQIIVKISPLFKWEVIELEILRILEKEI